MTLILKDDNGKELPKEVQNKVNDFIDNLPKIPWFNPSTNLKKHNVDKQINFILECFGIKAGIEYRKLQSKEDFDSAWSSAWSSAWASAWDSACDSAWVSIMDSAWSSAWSSARDSAWSSARASACDSACDSACASAWASAELLINDKKDFNYRYPHGVFTQLFKLWEMGLYPVGVMEDSGNFVVYADPKAKDLFKEDNVKEELPEEIEINGIIYIRK